MSRKLNDDTRARTAAGEHISMSTAVAAELGAEVADSFAAAEFETATSRVGGEEITLRRIVLTTAWEVAPK